MKGTDPLGYETVFVCWVVAYPFLRMIFHDISSISGPLVSLKDLDHFGSMWRDCHSWGLSNIMLLDRFDIHGFRKKRRRRAAFRIFC